MNPETTLVGARVRHAVHSDGLLGTVVKWEPLGAGLLDALVAWDDGVRCWQTSRLLLREDGVPIPPRDEVRRAAAVEQKACLEDIRARHVANFQKPWPGAEFGKAHLGRAIDAAIRDVESWLDGED